MIRLDYDAAAEWFVLTSTAIERELVKQINGVVAEGSGRWHLPATFVTWIDAASTVQLHSGEITEKAAQVGALLCNIVAGHGRLRLATDLWAAKEHGEVVTFPEQEADGIWLAVMRRACLYSQQRTGKTWTLCVALECLDEWPVLIVCPPALTLGWQKSLRSFFPQRTIGVLSKRMTAAQRKKVIAAHPEILVCSSSILAKHTKLVKYGSTPLTSEQREPKEFNSYGFKTVISDESHNHKNPKGVLARALWGIGDAAENRFVASGTPRRSSEEDLWAQFRFIRPTEFPAKSKFCNKYLHMAPGRFGVECLGINPQWQKHWDMLFNGLHIRRMRPPETIDYRTVLVEMSPEQDKLYKKMAEERIVKIGDEIVAATDGMSWRHRLLQIASGIPVVKDGSVTALMGPSSKAEALLEVLEESDEKAVVFAESRKLIEYFSQILDKAGIKHVMFVGKMSEVQQARAEKSFKEDESVKVVLALMSVAKEGLDFSTATREIFTQRSDDLVASEQSEARILGPMQKASLVEVIDIVSAGTLDEAVFTNSQNKTDKLKTLMNDPEWIRRNLYGTA